MIRIAEARLIILIIGLSHIISGTIITFVPGAALVTQYHNWTLAIHALGLNGQSHITVGAMLFLVGVSAVAASWLKLSPRSQVLLSYPQQIVLIGEFAAIVIAVFSGVYPDGYHPPDGWKFILTDQVRTMLFSIYHTIWIIWTALKVRDV